MSDTKAEDVYEVEAIVDHRNLKTGRERKIKWVGYTECTWEKRKGLLSQIQKMIEKYEDNDKNQMVKKKKSLNSEKLKVTEDEEYEIEGIIGHKDETGARKYLVKWKGYKEEEATYEPKENLLPNFKKGLEKYEREIKTKSNKGRKKNGRWSKRPKKKRKRDTKPDEPKESNYEVEYLLDHVDDKNGRKYLVKWKGYPKDQATYEQTENLNCDLCIKQYDAIRGKWQKPSPVTETKTNQKKKES